MARFDLNKDEKKDIFDSMIEYEIYKDVMGEEDESSQPSHHTPSYNSDSDKQEDCSLADWIINMLKAMMIGTKEERIKYLKELGVLIFLFLLFILVWFIICLLNIEDYIYIGIIVALVIYIFFVWPYK